MIEIEVLYADLSRKRVQLDQIASVSKAGVLFIIVQTDEENGKLKNIAHISGWDQYALCQRVWNGQPWIMLHGWDDDDYVWRRLSKPHDIDARKEVIAPLGCMNVIFHGQSVSTETWKEAMKIINKEIL